MALPDQPGESLMHFGAQFEADVHAGVHPWRRYRGCVKYFKSGGGWSCLDGISRPSALMK